MPGNIDRRSLLTGSLAGALASGQTRPTGRQPNILHIMSDQQQWATIAGRPMPHAEPRTAWPSRACSSSAAIRPRAVCCPARAMMLSGAYHWHNGVYNQIHSPPSVHRDMYPDVVLYSQPAARRRLPAGLRRQVARLLGARPAGFRLRRSGGRERLRSRAAARSSNNNPDNVRARQQATASRRRSAHDAMAGQPSRFAMWGYREGPEEATDRNTIAPSAPSA